ncbi:hypothetical protein GCM10009609_75610 [Pseudonocardia aurantiaca]
MTAVSAPAEPSGRRTTTDALAAETAATALAANQGAGRADTRRRRRRPRRDGEGAAGAAPSRRTSASTLMPLGAPAVLAEARPVAAPSRCVFTFSTPGELGTSERQTHNPKGWRVLADSNSL